jgi:hypothetical protein
MPEAPVAFGDMIRREGPHLLMDQIRIIGIEIKLRNFDGRQEELALLPCNLVIPNPHQNRHLRFEMPLTMHTTVGDFQGEIRL